MRHRMDGGPAVTCPTPGKTPYRRRRFAQDLADRTLRTQGVRLRVYHCPCGNYHLTTWASRRRKAIA